MDLEDTPFAPQLTISTFPNITTSGSLYLCDAEFPLCNNLKLATLRTHKNTNVLEIFSDTLSQ